MEEPGRSSDSGLPPPQPSQPFGQWRFRGERFPSQRRDRPGLAPGSLTGLRVERQPIIVRVPTPLRLWLPVAAWAVLIFALSSIPGGIVTLIVRAWVIRPRPRQRGQGSVIWTPSPRQVEHGVAVMN